MNEPRLTSGHGVHMKDARMTRRSLRSNAPVGLALPAAAMLLLAACSEETRSPRCRRRVGVVTIVPTEVINLADCRAGSRRCGPPKFVRASMESSSAALHRRLRRGRGAPLFRIDSRPLRASLDVQLAALRRAQAEATNAQRVVSRYRPALRAGRDQQAGI